MVTIVNKDPHPSVVKEVICRNCGVTLNYVPADVKKEIHTDYTGDSDTYHYIDCPNCSGKVGVRQ